MRPPPALRLPQPGHSHAFALPPPAPLLTLIPLVAVGAVWWISDHLYGLTILCTGRTPAGRCVSSLAPVGAVISRLRLENNATLAAYDVAGRFAWQSTLVLFLAVAMLVTIIGSYLAYRALKESGVGGAEAFLVLLVPLAMTVFAQAALSPHNNLLLVDILDPLVRKAFSPETYPADLITTTQSLFKGAAFMSSSIVVIAAGSALLTRTAAAPLDQKEHLVNQWRRLKHALFAGAALLVSAVLFQAAFFGWAHSLTQAVTADVEQNQLGVLSRVAKARADLEPHRAEYASVRSGLEAELKRLGADTVSAAARQRLFPLRNALDAAAARYRPDSVRVDSLLRALPADTAGFRIAAAPVTSAAARIDQLTTAGITQAGGLVYSVLLLVMYLPSALILMERARAMSLAQGTTETERDEWRRRHGLAITLWSQWTKVLAVLAPALSSIPAAKLILDLLQQ